MKITGSVLLFLLYEAPKAHGLSAYLNSIHGATMASSAYPVTQSSRPNGITPGHEYVSVLDSPASVVKTPQVQPVGSMQQPEASVASTPSEYMSVLGGSSHSTKPASYSGFNTKHKAVRSQPSYLNQVNSHSDSVMKQEPVSFGSHQQPEWTPAPPAVEKSNASAQTSADYMSVLGGSSQTTKKGTYAPFGAGKARTPVSSTGYLGNLKETTAETVAASPVAPETKAPVKATTASTSEYMSVLGGSSNASKRKPASYAPYGTKPKVDSGSSGGYMSVIGGSSRARTMIKSSYSPFGGKPKIVEDSTGYLGNLKNGPVDFSEKMIVETPVINVETKTESVQADSPPIDYMSALGGTSSAPKQSSYSPFGKKPTASGSNMGYLSQMKSSRMSSYSPYGKKPKAVDSGMGYLGQMKDGHFNTPLKETDDALVEPYIVEEAALVEEDIAPAVDFMSSVKSVPASVKASSYSPYGKKPIASGSNMGYLSQMKSSKVSSYSPFGKKHTAVDSNMSYLGQLKNVDLPKAPAMQSTLDDVPKTDLPPANYMSTFATSSSVPKKGSYSPFGSKPKAPKTQSGYLSDVATGKFTTSTEPAATASKAPQVEVSRPNNFARTSSSKPASFSPFGRKVRAPVRETGYLTGLAGGNKSPSLSAAAPARVETLTPPSFAGGVAPRSSAPKISSFSPFGKKVREPKNNSGYLSGLKQGGFGASPFRDDVPSERKSSIMDPLPAMIDVAKAMPASFSSYGAKPKRVATGGYLGSF